MRLTTAAAAITVVAITSSFASAGTLAGPITNSANGHRYYLLTQDTWANSESAAVALGGHLATVNDAAEQTFIANLGKVGGGQRLLWIGLNDSATEGQFSWTSGETSTYTNWAPGEPNNSQAGEDFVALYYPNHSSAGMWNDWSDRSSDPIGLPFNGIVEVVPEPATCSLVACVASMLARGRRR